MWTAIKLLLASRKFVVALLGVVSAVAARYGLAWNVDAMTLIVLPFLAVILGISYEDGQSKGAGAGTIKTTQREPMKGGGIAETTVIEPDPARKP